MRCEEVKMVVSKSCITRGRYPRGWNIGAVVGPECEVGPWVERQVR